MCNVIKTRVLLVSIFALCSFCIQTRVCAADGMHGYSKPLPEACIPVSSYAFSELADQDDESPSVDPLGTYVTVDGEELDDASASQSAPLVAHFRANPQNVGDYSARYEWKVWREADDKNLLVHRFDEDMDYTFTSSGSFRIQLYATFVLGNDTITYPSEGEENPIVVSISESKLEFPNAFSPNGDGYNDVLHAKEGYQSIVSFEATVFSRWGRKLYSWDSPSGGWDGKVNGHTVSDGVYFLIVKAKGADGRKYNIKKTISVLTGYDNSRQQGTGGADE